MTEKLTLKDIEDWLLIDKDDLDTESTKHPLMFRDVGRQYVFAESLAAKAKQEMEQRQAVVALDYRNQAAEDGTKMTEEKLKNLVRSDIRYMEACSDYNEALKKEAFWKNEVEAHRHKGYAIGNLIKLHGDEYYFSDNADRITSAKKKVQEKRNKKKKGE